MERHFLNQTIQIPVFEITEVTIHKVHYKTNKIIGQGKNGTVYLATDTTNNRLVALKVIEIDDDKEHIQRIENEMKCLKRLQEHCGQYVLCYIDSDVITINQEYDDDVIETNYYVIVTQFLENYITWSQFNKKYQDKNLRDQVKKKIREAIEYIHNKNIYHGDIHYDNVLIHPDTFDVRIIDFGYCKLEPQPKFYQIDKSNLEWHIQHVDE